MRILLLHDDIGLYVVADGGGGAQAGEEASFLAVDVIATMVRGMLNGDQPVFGRFPGDITDAERLLGTAVMAANTAIYTAGLKNRALSGMCIRLLQCDYGRRVANAHVGVQPYLPLANWYEQQLTTIFGGAGTTERIITREEMETSDMRISLHGFWVAFPDVDIALSSQDIEAAKDSPCQTD
jgi:hypothetical protein